MDAGQGKTMFFAYYWNPVLIAAAVFPALFLLVQVWRLDRLERESPRLLLNLVLQGVLATFLAYLTERFGTLFLEARFQKESMIFNLLLFFVVVGLSEEGFKYLLMRRRTWRSPEFNCQFDGVVYATFVSLGFALFENIEYVVAYGFSTAVVRAVTAIPGHACFGVFMGAFYGAAKRLERYGKPAASKACRILAVLIPTLLHGAYDYIASVMQSGMSLYFWLFVAALFLCAYLLVRQLARTDRYI